ncbi:MAG: hypothetical protein NC300_08320 [Bacteroidales bacterium]|nr:hypothetical protein [Clostridium sp.]MCM1204136.1 hypothetical protein [Bacteroidales bacterium]
MKLKKRMKKAGLCAMLALVFCMAAGCGNSGTKNRLKTGEERAVELKEDAREVVGEVNEETDNINQTVDSLEEE